MPAKRKTRAAKEAGAPPVFMRVARPDAIDFRDRPFRPNVSVAPAATLFPSIALPIKHQGPTNACTGFALSCVVEYLLRRSGRDKAAVVSPYMLYSMARRYDEFPGSVEDEGSSLRGALKGWFKHGACAEALWDTGVAMPKQRSRSGEDWWLDAVWRPLGAYYRIDTDNIADMHAALNEVGILYCSAGCHSGWDEGLALRPMARRPTSFSRIWTIPRQGGQAMHPGHAFAILGYNEVGFLIHNSWGPGWGSHGYAVLAYDDWLANAMDCWVAQLGVVTREHRAISQAPTLRVTAEGKVVLATSTVLRDRELSPFILNVGNNGFLSNSGVFRTREEDVRALVDIHLAEARRRWDMKDEPIDVCVYAHGGNIGEKQAAEVAARWIPTLYEQRIFPIFLMWETDFWSTLGNLLEDALKGVPLAARGVGTSMQRWWNQRIERLLARPGTLMWNELKQNADAISLHPQAGAVLLYQHFKSSIERKRVRMHLVGHSAGSIVLSYIVERLVGEGMGFESISFFAPAVRIDVFDRLVRPRLEDGSVRRFQQFHLSERAEQEDRSWWPYGRSVLYLVSESFEGGVQAPLLGLQRYFDAYAKKLPNALAHVAPGPRSAATVHGAFSEDPLTMSAVIDFIRKG